MDYNTVGIKIIIEFGEGKTVIFIDLICSVLNCLAVLSEVVIVVMRLVVSADIYTDKTGEINILTVHYPVCIAAVNAKAVLSVLVKYCGVCDISGNICNLGSPAVEAVGISACFFLYRCLAAVNRHITVGY